MQQLLKTISSVLILFVENREGKDRNSLLGMFGNVDYHN